MALPAPTPSRGHAPPEFYLRSCLVGPGRSELINTPMPVCGPHDVLIRVRYVGVCASELHDWRTGLAGGASLILGHEPAGDVVATGSEVGVCAVGDLVTGRIDPAFAEYAIAADHDVVKVPPGVPADAAAVGGEPFGCVVEGMRRTPLDVADRVAVIGAGFMGLCLIQLLALQCTSRLVAVDLRADAREQALRHGADEVISPEALGPGRAAGFDVVFEASGSQAGLDLATELVAPHRTLSILGYHQQPRIVDMQTWNYRAITVVNAHVRDRERMRDSIRRGLDLIAAGRIDVASLITHRFPLAELDRAFTALADKPDGFVKALLEVSAQP
jgi:threonine dehydrogenase-like Zn-dependent dehydrogenase